MAARSGYANLAIALAFTRRTHQTRRMRRQSRTLTDQDVAMWGTFARFVRPLPGRAVPLDAAPAVPMEVTEPAPLRLGAPKRPVSLPHIVTGVQPPGLDNASWGRFRSGRLAPTRKLDLHGKTVHAAYHALERFLHTAQADRVRCVEIITGRGRAEGSGAIRRELPLWLGLPSLRPLILAATHPHAANDGATRLLLRRGR